MLPAQSDHTTLAHGQLAQVYNRGVFRWSSVRISCGLIERDEFVGWTCSWFNICREGPKRRGGTYAPVTSRGRFPWTRSASMATSGVKCGIAIHDGCI